MRVGTADGPFGVVSFVRSMLRRADQDRLAALPRLNSEEELYAVSRENSMLINSILIVRGCVHEYCTSRQRPLTLRLRPVLESSNLDVHPPSPYGVPQIIVLINNTCSNIINISNNNTSI